jgi:Arc/MetJ-type ribon-helix-helix transcriptional regulator
MSVDTVTLKIPRPLYERMQELIEGTEYRSPTEFVLFVLRVVLRDLAGAENEDLELVRNRLKILGYL